MHSLSVYLHRVAFSFCFCLFNMTDTANLKAVVRRRTVSHTPPFGVEHPPKPHSGLPEGTDRTSKMRDVALPVLRATGPAPPRDAPGGNNTLCVPAPHIQPGPETGDATTSQANKSTGGAGHRADRVSWPLPAQTQRKGVRRRGAKTPRGHDVVTTPLPSARRSAMSSYHRGTAEVAAPPPPKGVLQLPLRRGRHLGRCLPLHPPRRACLRHWPPRQVCLPLISSGRMCYNFCLTALGPLPHTRRLRILPWLMWTRLTCGPPMIAHRPVTCGAIGRTVRVPTHQVGHCLIYHPLWTIPLAYLIRRGLRTLSKCTCLSLLHNIITRQLRLISTQRSTRWG